MKKLFYIPLIFILLILGTIVYAQYIAPTIDFSSESIPGYIGGQYDPSDSSGWSEADPGLTPDVPYVTDTDVTPSDVISPTDAVDPQPEVIPEDVYDGLTINSRGEDVQKLQERLIELGYLPGRADGIFGKNTERAVHSFQQTAGLFTSGTANRYTVDLIYSDDAPKAAESVDHEDVRDPSYATDYYIIVYLDNCTVLVLGKDAFGHYNQVAKVFTCSVGLDEDDNSTPPGLYALGDRYEWCLMVDDSYSQYAIRYDGSYMMHSVTYHTKSADNLIMEEYEKLGSPASHGCVRLCAGDIKWVFDNAKRYTQLHIIDGKNGPEQPAVTPLNYDEPYNGWDPTDPAAESPFNN